MHPNISIPLRMRRRGFTLTEIAIVLGIIGAILGAIWVAAASASNSQKVGKAIGQILTISGGMSATYSKGIIQGGSQPLSPFAMSSGMVPADMITTSCSGAEWGANWGGGTLGCALNPWGEQVIMDTQGGWGGAPIAANKYEFLLGPTTNAQCAAFLGTLVPQAATNGGAGLVWVYSDATGGTAVTTATQPTAFATCSGNIVLQFQL